ncbi:hypothetical protein [Candidatus Tisiphia endosymbiont of Ceraclea dissimilis]|uniref:hypothetical protein n=1 Tax=Candidatus Tisiphia endosymbiont of Ceraclea dissimilis TaxID=3077928 RepID=UPI003CCA9AD2
MSNDRISKAVQIVKNYSLFTEEDERAKSSLKSALTKFFDTINSDEKEECFKTILKYGNVPSNELENLRAKLNGLFDKQQDLAVNNPAITEPSRNDTQYAGTDIKSPISRTVLNNDKIDRSNKPNVSQIDPVIVNIDNQKYAVCVKDDNKYLVWLENQTTNAMVLGYNQANGITGIFNNSDMYDIKQISVNGESKEIFLGSFTTGTSSSAHSVGVVIYKDTDGQYKTTVLDQTSFKNNSDAKPEYQEKYKGFIKGIHSAIKGQHQNIKIDEQNIDFRHGVYQVEGNLAGCLDGLMFFADDLIKENFDVHKALTHAAEEIPLSRMASSRFNATCAVMEQNEQKVGLEQIPLGDINKKLDLKEFFTNSSDVETIKKIRDGSYSKSELAKIFVDDFGVQVKYLNEKVKQSLKESLNKFNDIPEIKLLTSGNFDNKALAKIITNNFTHEELADTFITKCRSEELFPKIITDNFTDKELSAIKNGDKKQGITIIIKKFDINQLAEIFIDNYNEEVLSRTRSGKSEMEDIFRNNIPREQRSLYTQELELLSNNITNQEAKEAVLTKQLYKTKLKTTLESKFQKTELQKILEQSYRKEELETMLKKAFMENKPSIKAVVDDIGFLRKLTDAELQSLEGKEVQGKITQLLKQEVIQLQTAKQQDVTLDNQPIAPLKPTIVQSVTPGFNSQLSKELRQKATLIANNLTQQNSINTIASTINIVETVVANQEPLSEVIGNERGKSLQNKINSIKEKHQQGDIKGVDQGFKELADDCIKIQDTKMPSTWQKIVNVIKAAASIVSTVIRGKSSDINIKMALFRKALKELGGHDSKFSECSSMAQDISQRNKHKSSYQGRA